MHDISSAESVQVEPPERGVLECPVIEVKTVYVYVGCGHIVNNLPTATQATKLVF
jgi:hypothetical protein